MTLGLVRGWGLVAPRWLPFVGGSPVRAGAAVTVALLGALIMTAATVSHLMIWDTVVQGNLTGTRRAVMGWLYAPLLFVGAAAGAGAPLIRLPAPTAAMNTAVPVLPVALSLTVFVPALASGARRTAE